MTVRVRGSLAAVVMLSLLAGCDVPDTGPERLRDYSVRLTRAIGQESRPTEPDAPPSIVAAQLEPLPLPASQIGMLDFLSLTGCDLQQNLGRRNSHLGRHASSSQQLLLDLEFLEQAPRCINRIEAKNPALAQQLSVSIDEKRAALPNAIYNAVLAGPEWRRFWRQPAALGEYPADSNDDIGSTLNQLANRVERWLAGDPQADNLGFESLLSELRAGDGGALLLAATVQGNALAVASDAVDRQQAAGSLCPFGSDTADSRRLRTVAAKYFAGQVQPWLADLRRRQALLLPPVQRIERALQNVLPAAYREWQQARDDVLATLTAAPRRHAQTISESLDDCGGIGGQNASL